MKNCSPFSAHLLSRRKLLLAGSALAGAAAIPRAWAQTATDLQSGRLIVLLLRGAYDGLSAVVPYADPEYAQLRSSTLIPAPDGTLTTAIRLDNRFALHPALAPLLPLWQDGSLAFVHASGSPDPSRSHFEAQHYLEAGIPGKNSDSPGWLNKLANPTAHVESSAAQIIGVGEANPNILAGLAPTRLIPRGQQALRTGVLGNERSRTALMDLYSGQDKLSEAFRAGAASRLLSAQELSQEMTAADNGAGSAAGLALDAQHLGKLMRADRKLRIGFLSAGGWDTHANQGAVEGTLARNLGSLAQAIVQLRNDFKEPGDTLLVISEFGRTAAENGTRGTDHGHGNAMWLIGSRINGGQIQGHWEGLASGNLHEGRDLPVLNDFRSVIAQALAVSFKLPESKLADIFPGGKWDSGLESLVKRGV